jgi:hypothetical protein
VSASPFGQQLMLDQISGAYLFITFFPDQAEKLLQMAPTG